jgi:PAT family beta-lactamase induction signal transducer AmpG
LAVGVAGSLFTLMLMLLRRSPAVFAVAFIGENVFQALAITISVAITFEAIGRRNPLAATIFCFLSSAYNIPITYMLIVDGWGYGKRGVAGSFAADASLGVVASVLLGALLIWVTPRRPLVPIGVPERS